MTASWGQSRLQQLWWGRGLLCSRAERIAPIGPACVGAVNADGDLSAAEFFENALELRNEAISCVIVVKGEHDGPGGQFSHCVTGEYPSEAAKTRRSISVLKASISRSRFIIGRPYTVSRALVHFWGGWRRE